MNEQEWEDKLAEVQKNSEHWYNKYKELETENNKLLDVINNQDVKIADLEKKNADLKDRLELLNLNANIAVRDLNDLLTKAVELLKWALHSDPEHDNLVDFDTKWKEAEQFLKEIEK